MSQHTPGPWHIDYQQDDAPYIVAEQGKAWDNPTICHLYQDVTPEDSVTIGRWLEALPNATANARLIASAPELLSALNAIVARIQGDWDHPDLVRYGPLQLASHDCLEIARAAIAKAEGNAKSYA